MTLFVVPVLYDLLNGRKMKAREIQMIREAAGMNGDAVLEEPTPVAPPAPAVPVPVEKPAPAEEPAPAAPPVPAEAPAPDRDIPPVPVFAPRPEAAKTAAKPIRIRLGGKKR